MNQSIVRACPNQVFCYRRLRDCEDGVVVLGSSVVNIDGTARRLLLALVIASQIRTDGFPVHASVRGLKQTFTGVIKRVWIVR